MNTSNFTNQHELEYKIVPIKVSSSQIDETLFQKLKQCLDSYKLWTKTEHICIHDTFYKNGIRKSSFNDNVLFIKKKSIKQEYFTINNLYKLKMCISEENPCTFENNSTIHLERYKQRYSYYDLHWHFDLTIVNYNSYELELEFHDLAYIRSHTLQFLNNLAIQEIQHLLSANT